MFGNQKVGPERSWIYCVLVSSIVVNWKVHEERSNYPGRISGVSMKVIWVKGRKENEAFPCSRRGSGGRRGDLIGSTTLRT